MPTKDLRLNQWVALKTNRRKVGIISSISGANYTITFKGGSTEVHVVADFVLMDKH